VGALCPGGKLMGTVQISVPLLHGSLLSKPILAVAAVHANAPNVGYHGSLRPD